jgi:hypothetical protein
MYLHPSQRLRLCMSEDELYSHSGWMPRCRRAESDYKLLWQTFNDPKLLNF